MSNPLNRGSSPDRARDASQRPGTFKPGHKKMGGRKKGTPNALSADYKSAVLEAAYRVGRDGNGADGLVGYFQRLLIKCPEVGGMLLGRMFLHEEDGWPPDDRTLTKEQVNAEVRELIERNKADSGDPEAAVAWPVIDLMRIAAKYPRDFGKLFAAMVPQPRGRPRRSRWEGMTPTSEEERNAGLEFLAACALLKGRT
jgi:hypothetical protein